MMLSTKTLLQLTGTIFGIVGLVHMIRLLTGFDVIIAGWMVPMWISLLGVVVAWYLSYNAFTLSKQKKTKKESKR